MKLWNHRIFQNESFFPTNRMISRSNASPHITPSPIFMEGGGVSGRSCNRTPIPHVFGPKPAKILIALVCLLLPDMIKYCLLPVWYYQMLPATRKPFGCQPLVPAVNHASNIHLLTEEDDYQEKRCRWKFRIPFLHLLQTCFSLCYNKWPCFSHEISKEKPCRDADQYIGIVCGQESQLPCSGLEAQILNKGQRSSQVLPQAGTCSLHPIPSRLHDKSNCYAFLYILYFFIQCIFCLCISSQGNPRWFE